MWELFEKVGMLDGGVVVREVEKFRERVEIFRGDIGGEGGGLVEIGLKWGDKVGVELGEGDMLVIVKIGYEGV